MLITSNNSRAIPTVVSYVTPEFDARLLKEAKGLQDLYHYVLSQTQGEAVMLYETLDIASLMFVMSVIYKTSSELVFVSKDGVKTQIFDFTFAPAIRPSDISTSFAILDTKISSVIHKDIIRLDIEHLWNSHASEDLSTRIYDCVQDIISTLSLCKKAVLIGVTPSVLFLLTQHYLSGKTEELWYQESENSKAIKIY